MALVSATKIFHFDSAHKLNDYFGACANLHGHTYELHVTVTGNAFDNGMVIDFKDLKQIVKENVISKLDHSFLNDIVVQPTAENLAIWIWGQLYGKIPVTSIKLYETPDSYVTYNGN